MSKENREIYFRDLRKESASQELYAQLKRPSRIKKQLLCKNSIKVVLNFLRFLLKNKLQKTKMTTETYIDWYEHKLTIQLLAELRLNESLESKIVCNSYITCRHNRTITNNWEMRKAYAKNYYLLLDSTRKIKVIISRALPWWYTRKNADS